MAAGFEDVAVSAENEMVRTAPCPPPPDTDPRPLRLTPDVLREALKKYGVHVDDVRVDTSDPALVRIEEVADKCFKREVSDLIFVVAYVVSTSIYTRRLGADCTGWVEKMRQKYDRELPVVLLHGAREAGLIGADGTPCPHRERLTDKQRYMDLEIYLADM